MASMWHPDSFKMEHPWTPKFSWNDAPSIGAAPLPPPRVPETSPPEDASISLLKKRLDALTAQLDSYKLRLDRLETNSRPPRHDPSKVLNKWSDHAGLFIQATSHLTPGANILADVKVIARSGEDRKKIRRWKGVFKDHYSVSWDDCQMLNGLEMVGTGMIDVFNIRANLHILSKWRRPKHRPQRRRIQRTCDYWIGVWHHDPLIHVPSEALHQLWALYDS
ncbi:hypothetical protein N7453_003523 [Penicillium expansum]|nr:hypothetical protein N7453_003523 [Penicillium expansum]